MRAYRWLPFAFSTSVARALWALAAAHGCAWQLIWLPAVAAGASPRRDRTGGIGACLRQLLRDGRA